jgi:Protein of unknown function (DUF3108)
MRSTPLLVLLVCSPLATSQSAAPPQTFHYNIEWRLITAGKAQVEWIPGNSPEVKLHVESVGLVSKLFRVEDDYTAILNQSLCVQAVHLATQEGSRQRDTRITFDGAAHRASYLERDLVKNSTLLAKEIEIPNCVHDVVGGLLFLRTLSLEPGQSTQVPVSDGKKSVSARVEAQQREDVKTPEGTFHTIRYEIYLFNGVLYQRSAHLNVWLTDDRRKLPVQLRVRMPVTIGTITLLLEKHE